MRPLPPRGNAPASLLFVAGLVALALVSGITVAVVKVLDLDDGGADDGAVATATTAPGATDTTTGGAILPAPDQVRVTGIATGVTLEGITLERIDLPIVVNTPERGFGSGGEIFQVLVDGEDASLVWDAGRPFDLRGADGAALLPGRLDVFAAPDLLTVGFPDDELLGITPGTYTLDTPVAVGSHGLANPREQVTFETTDETNLSFSGGATAAIAARDLDVQGPGRVLLEGRLEILHPDGTTTRATTVELPAGPFLVRATLRTDGTGYDVEATLQGEITTG